MSGRGWDIRIEGRLGRLHLQVELEAHERPTAIVGPNGSGKTTLLRILSGARIPVSGHIRLNGRVLLDSAGGVDLPPESRGVGYLPQGYALFPHLTALDNVAFGLAGASTKERRARALSLLAELDADSLAGRRPAQLSGGEQQRVALARALAIQPEGLLLDEPLAAMDATSRRTMRSFLADYLSTGRRPALVVTHDLRDVLALGGEVVVIERGRVVQRGRADDLARQPLNDFVAELFQSPVAIGPRG